MVSRSGDLELERSGLEVQKQITVEVEVTRLFVPIPPARQVPGPEFSEGASERPLRPDRVRKENFNEETRAKAGISFYLRWDSTFCIVFEALPREQRTLRVCCHQY
jgi:hypothetical protein